MIIKDKFNVRGESLLELIIAVGILIVVISAVVVMSLSSLGGIGRSEDRLQAVALAQEGVEACKSIKDYSWPALSSGPHGLSDASGHWELIAVPDVTGIYTRKVTVTDVNSYTKDVLVRIEWSSSGAANFIQTFDRFTNWQSLSWVSRVQTDLAGGSNNSVAPDSGGGISLAHLGDFRYSAVVKNIDFEGEGDIQDVYANGNKLYIVTTNTGSEEEFMVFDISNISNLNITEMGSSELGTDANKMAADEKYVYIATNNNSAEVKIIRLADRVNVANINLPSSAGANGIFLDNNNLYVVASKSSSKEFFKYNVSDPEHPGTSPLASVEINANVNDVALNNGYAYLLTDSDNGELKVIRLSDNQIVNTVDLESNADGVSIEILNNIAYIGTSGNSAGPEFFVLNIAVPTSIQTLASLDVGNEKVTDCYPGVNNIFVATHAGSAEELTIIDAHNYSIKGDIDLSGNPEATAVMLYGSYLYIGSKDNTNTLQIVKGADSTSEGYVESGVFTSPAFNSGSDTTSYSTITWTQEGSGTIKFQLRAAATETGLAQASWVGPDGTSASYYAVSGSNVFLPAGVKRWIQYRAVLGGDSVTAPILKDVIINYAI